MQHPVSTQGQYLNSSNASKYSLKIRSIIEHENHDFNVFQKKNHFKHSAGFRSKKEEDMDPFIASTLNYTAPDLFEKLSGASKKPNYISALESLKIFGEKANYQTFSNQDKALMQSLMLKFKQEFMPPDGSIKILSPYHACSVLPTLNTSAGFGFNKQKKKDCTEEAIQRAWQLIEQIGSQTKTMDTRLCKIGVRCQVKLKQQISEWEIKVKQRPIWIVPFDQIILETMYSQPLQKYLQNQEKLMMMGSGMFARLSKLLQKNIEPKKQSIFSCDWSNFDARLPRFVITTVMKVFYDAYNTDVMLHRDGTESPIKEQHFKNIYKWLHHNLVKTHFITSDGSHYQKKKGLPSGSAWTQIIGSAANWFIIQFVCAKHDSSIGILSLVVLGDDSHLITQYIRYPKQFLESISLIAFKYFGMVLNPDKCQFSQTSGGVSFLSYNIANNRVYRTYEDLLTVVLYPRDLVQSVEESISRLVSYIPIGGGSSFLFKQFFYEFCAYHGIYEFEFTRTPADTRYDRYVSGLEAMKGKQIKVSDIDWDAGSKMLVTGEQLIK